MNRDEIEAAFRDLAWRAGFDAGWSEGRKWLRKAVESRGNPDDETYKLVQGEFDG